MRLFDAQLAEEVAHVVFSILARKAGSLGPKTILSVVRHRSSSAAVSENARCSHGRLMKGRTKGWEPPLPDPLLHKGVEERENKDAAVAGLR
jgi:hypothetical protein